MMFSIILEKKDETDIGLLLVILSDSPDLKMGTTFASLSLHGKIPSINDTLII